MASAFDRIFADIRKDIPSVPDAVVRQELFRVMDDFTQSTNIWQETVPLPIVPDVNVYPITVTDGQPNRLMLVYDTAADTPRWPMSGIMMREPGIITIYRKPVSSANWAAIVAKRTAEPLDATTKYPIIDDWIVDKYADTIGRGLIARLQFQPQKPYSNPMLGQMNQRSYTVGKGRARANDGHVNIYNAQNWTFPQGWATTSRYS
jgi:hypothetical protein